MGCGVVPGNVYAFSGCHCGPYPSSINNRSPIGMIGCYLDVKVVTSIFGSQRHDFKLCCRDQCATHSPAHHPPPATHPKEEQLSYSSNERRFFSLADTVNRDVTKTGGQSDKQGRTVCRCVLASPSCSVTCTVRRNKDRNGPMMRHALFKCVIFTL